MKLSPYARYKASGVEWIGDVPEYWSVFPIRRSHFILNGGTPSSSEESYWDGEINWITPEDLGRNEAKYIGAGRRTLSIEGSQNCGVQLAPRDSIVLSTRAPIGHVAITDRESSTNQGCRTLLPYRQGVNSSFVYYSLIASRSILQASGKGSTFMELASGALGAHQVPSPPAEEQRAIAAFLDRETAKLDTLVEKKRALIEKLKEKRAALISRTVTRGLPPDAARAAGLNPHPKLKPSGVEWIGDVPEHWRVKAVKHVATIGNGSTPHRDNAEYWEDGSYPWLNSSVVNQIRVTAAEQFVTDTALAQCHLPRISPPAVLVGITGEGKTRGMATTLCIEATINQHMAYIKPKGALADVGYLHRVFERAYFYLRNESDGGGSTKGAITCEQIANLKLPLPSIEEQQAIANYLDHETTKIDRLTEKIEAAIERLREYRTALITAAVTGKIDVRGTAA